MIELILKVIDEKIKDLESGICCYEESIEISRKKINEYKQELMELMFCKYNLMEKPNEKK